MKKIIMTQLETKSQKRSLRTTLFVGLLVLGQALLLWAPGSLSAPQAYEAYYRFLGDYPDQEETEWAEDVQGITHDQNNWFITQGEDREDSKLWRIPVEHDLNNVSCSDSRVPNV